MIAAGSSRNNPKESFRSNDKARNYFLEEASKMTQERNRNFKPREMPSARIHHTPNYCGFQPERYSPLAQPKVDSEPPNGSNEDITNPYECNQTLNVSAGTLNLSAVSPTPYVPPSKKDYEILLQSSTTCCFSRSGSCCCSRAVDPAGSPSSTTIDQDVPSANLNIPANIAPAEQAPVIAPPTRTDDQILPSSKWMPISKSNSVLDVQKSQRNPIFSIAVAILKNTNFFRAFTAS
ncbi:hypothetical protein Tco_1334223, partial [Tanacetum coccineum]